jgi:hypothetical protein
MWWSKVRVVDEFVDSLQGKSHNESRRRAKHSRHGSHKVRRSGRLSNRISILLVASVIGVALPCGFRLVYRNEFAERLPGQGAISLPRSLYHGWEWLVHSLIGESPAVDVREFKGVNLSLAAKDESLRREAASSRADESSNLSQSNIEEPMQKPVIASLSTSTSVIASETSSTLKPSVPIESGDTGSTDSKSGEVVPHKNVSDLDMLDPEEGGEDPIIIVPGRGLELSAADRRFVERENAESRRLSLGHS